MKYFLTLSLVLLCISVKAQSGLGNSSPTDSSSITIKTELGLPFGEIARLEVEIYDGDDLNSKSTEGVYMLKVKSINNREISDTILLSFIDETGTLANDEFGLYELIYKKKTGSLSSRQIEKMEKHYVGKSLL